MIGTDQCDGLIGNHITQILINHDAGKGSMDLALPSTKMG